MWHELTKYGYFGLGALKRTKSVRAATRVVMEQYERPGEPHFELRLGYAQAVYKRFKD